jgi:hypothetical protein
MPSIINNALFKNYFIDHDFIRGVGLGEMGYNRRSYKKTISNFKFIRLEVDFNLLLLFFCKINIFTSCYVSKCPYGS